jgi:hypothetical protein
MTKMRGKIANFQGLYKTIQTIVQTRTEVSYLSRISSEFQSIGRRSTHCILLVVKKRKGKEERIEGKKGKGERSGFSTFWMETILWISFSSKTPIYQLYHHPSGA